MERPSAGDQFVQSLARGLDVITAFNSDRPSMTLSEVAAETGLTRAAARRFLLTLVTLGYLRNDGKYFRLAPQILRLGTAYLSGLQLPEIAQPHLEALTAKIKESSSVAVLDGTDIVYVVRIQTKSIMSVGITIGTRFPAHATSMGRVLLAAMPPGALDEYFNTTDLVPVTEHTLTDELALRAAVKTSRVQGWSYNNQELAIGLRSLAAPLHDRTGAVIAAINVSSTVTHDPCTEYLPNLLRTSAAIDKDLYEMT